MTVPQRRAVHYRHTDTMRRLWKWIGLAGVVGVATGGVLVARDQRRRKAYTPNDVRARLHQRLADSDQKPVG